MLKALTEKAGHMQDQMGISERWKAQGKKKKHMEMLRKESHYNRNEEHT